MKVVISDYIDKNDRYLSGRDEGNDFKKMLDKDKIQLNFFSTFLFEYPLELTV